MHDVIRKITKKRKIIVHFHIFKNAGCTIDYIMRNNFHKHYFSYDNPGQSYFISGNEGIEYIYKNPAMKVFSSHQLLYPLPEDSNLTVYSIFLLRHPIDRIGSIYRFEKKHLSFTQSSLKAKVMDFKEYVLWKLDNGGKTMRNFHVHRLSYPGNGDITTFRKRLLTNKELDTAKGRLKNSGYFGIVERFDDSLLLMKDYLQKDFPDIDYSYVIQNKSTDIENIEQRLYMIREQLGAQLYENLLKINDLDIELYNYALNIFKNRIESIGVENNV